MSKILEDFEKKYDLWEQRYKDLFLAGGSKHDLPIMTILTEENLLEAVNSRNCVGSCKIAYNNDNRLLIQVYARFTFPQWMKEDMENRIVTYLRDRVAICVWVEVEVF